MLVSTFRVDFNQIFKANRSTVIMELHIQ